MMNDTAQNNVVMMNRFEKPRSVPGTSGFLLNECRDMAASGMGEALSSMLDKAVDELFALSEKSLHHEMRNLYMDAMTLARDQRGEIEAGFARQFVAAFNREVRRTISSGGANVRSETLLHSMELSLVAPDDLEESLASINITNSIHDDCGEELFGLEKRMGLLLNDPDLVQTDNPLGPEVIGKSFMSALKDLECPVKVKLVLVNLFNKHMPRNIRDVYHGINQHLVEKGILEKIRVGMRKPRHVAASQDRHVAEAGADSTGGSGEIGLFEALQQLLSRGGPTAAPAPAMPRGGADGPGLSVVNALTRLQQGQFEGVWGSGGGLDAAMLADGQVNVLREIKSSAVAGGMAQVEAMTLDIVAMLFDYILDDRRIPDALKALIGRLQIPVLKVAMLDKSFFSQKAHPARKLLDRLAEVSIGWNEEEGHQGGLYKTVEDLIQRVLNEFDDKVDLFGEVLEGLEQYLAQERKRADELTGLSAQLVHHREREEIAKIMAHEEIRRRVLSPQLPEVIGNFLVGCWEGVLVAAYAQAGEDGEPWARAVETLDQLIWSVEPKRVPDDRKRLVSLLPGLLKRLQEGMALVGLPDGERDQFFARLVRCHADAVKSGLEAMAAAGEAPAAFVAQAFTAEENAQGKAEPADFTEITLPEESIAPDPAFVETLAGEDDSAWPALAIADTDWNEAPASARDDYDAMVKRLKRGTWIEIEQTNGASTRVKLAWVSPLKGLYLFTNRLGERAMSITPAGLAEKFRNGFARVIDDIALVDSAVNNLMERLKQPLAVAG